MRTLLVIRMIFIFLVLSLFVVAGVIMPQKDMRIWQSIFIGWVVIIQILLSTLFLLNELYFVKFSNKNVGGLNLKVAYLLYLIPVVVAIAAAYSAI